MNRESSQSTQILAALQNGRKLTCLDILRDYGCMNAKGRLHELRRAGNHIEDEWVKLSSGAKVKRYFMRDVRQPELPL